MQMVLLEKGNASISLSNERILLVEKEDEILSEKALIVQKDNNVLLKKNNEVWILLSARMRTVIHFVLESAIHLRISKKCRINLI